jgi:hypothetical protein
MGSELLKGAAIQFPMIALALVAAFTGQAAADDRSEAQRLLKAHIDYLCSDALEGRGLGSKGVDSAAAYLADRFREYGLKTSWYAGTPFQEFNGAMVIQLGPNNRLSLVGPSGDPAKPERIELVLGEDYIPLARGGSGKLSLPLVFAGYGIASAEKGYDDYKDLDITGKAVLLFDAWAPDKIHTWQVKELVARRRGAQAVVFTSTAAAVQRSRTRDLEQREKFITNLAEECKKFRAVAEPTPAEVKKHLTDVDMLLSVLTQAQGSLYDLHEVRLAFADMRAAPEDPGYPVIHIRRSIVDRVLKAAAKTDTSALEKKIEEDLKPQSVALSGWSLEGEVQVERSPIKAKNVIAVVEGAGELADQTIVLGAHYDGVGFRDVNWLGGGLETECPIIAPQTRYDPRMAVPRALHPAANDNASGAAVILEVARRMAEARQSPRRRVVFIAFGAEEVGYIGSKAYVRQPLFPLEKTIAMINLDMVGRLQGGRMNVFGAAPPGLVGDLLDQLDPRHQFKFNKLLANRTSLDQAAFERHRVPTLFFSSGPDEEMHLTGDRPDRLNYDGMRQISEMLAEFITALATNPKRPEYRDAK